MKRLTGRAWTLARAELHACAVQIGRVVEPKLGWGTDFDRFRDEIAENERQHRRSAPAGYRHRLPVASAVDYFVVRTFADALAAGPDELVRDLVGMRPDYIRARLMLHTKGVREALRCGRPGHPAETIAEWIDAVAKRYDYSEMVGE